MRVRAPLLLTLAGAALLPAAWPRLAGGSCRCGSGTTEICILLDTTSSMDIWIGTVKEQLYRMVAALEGSAETLRVGAVIYRTSEGPEYVTRKLDLSEDRKPLLQFIKDAKAIGGGYEAVSEGLEAAINGMSWTKGARKLIILVGDEGPKEDLEERCRALARLAKSRGIATSAITCSDTAWRYWNWVHAEEWKQRKAQLGEARAIEEFQLPIFQAIAKEGGGLGVPSKDTKELLRWLLVIASGAPDMSREEVKKFMEWEPGAPDRLAGRAPMITQLRYAGEWTTPRNFEALRAALGQKVRLDFDSAVEVAAAGDRELAGRPLVYLTGHGAIALDPAEQGALRRYLERGGLLWADACCGRKEFDAAFRKLAAEIFPEGKLAPLAADHPLYRSGYAIDAVRFAQRPRTAGTTFAARPARLEGLYLGKRLAVVYSPDSLGCGWASYPLGRPCQLADEDALKLSINILLYALTGTR